MLPLLLTAPAIHGLWRYLGEGRRSEAVRLMLGWALALAVFGPIAMAVAPEAAETSIFRGAEYRDEMLAWLGTGEGSEGNLRLFLPVHLQRLALFVPLSLVSGGALGLLMGAVMLNFMDFFVASYAAAASGVPAALAWFPWALCRVAAFVILGVILAEPLVRRLGKVTAPLQPGRGRLALRGGWATDRRRGPEGRARPHVGTVPRRLSQLTPPGPGSAGLQSAQPAGGGRRDEPARRDGSRLGRNRTSRHGGSTTRRTSGWGVPVVGDAGFEPATSTV